MAVDEVGHHAGDEHENPGRRLTSIQLVVHFFQSHFRSLFIRENRGSQERKFPLKEKVENIISFLVILILLPPLSPLLSFPRLSLSLSLSASSFYLILSLPSLLSHSTCVSLKFSVLGHPWVSLAYLS